MRVLKAPWAKVPVRSMRELWARAARSSLASARSGCRPFASRTSFMAVSNEDSGGVSVVVEAASAAPAKLRAVTTTATPVRTRLATSGGM